MADRRPPYARILAVLRILSWPCRYPTLSWWVAFVDWASVSNRRLTGVIVPSVMVVVGSITWKVTRG